LRETYRETDRQRDRETASQTERQRVRIRKGIQNVLFRFRPWPLTEGVIKTIIPQIIYCVKEITIRSTLM